MAIPTDQVSWVANRMTAKSPGIIEGTLGHARAPGGDSIAASTTSH